MIVLYYYFQINLFTAVYTSIRQRFGKRNFIAYLNFRLVKVCFPRYIPRRSRLILFAIRIIMHDYNRFLGIQKWKQLSWISGAIIIVKYSKFIVFDSNWTHWVKHIFETSAISQEKIAISIQGIRIEMHACNCTGQTKMMC